MDRKNFGKLIVALRQEQLDEHNASWTRQRFAEESGIDQDILANIETGRKAILYSDLLVQIATALKLTSGERKEFFLAASGVDEEHIYHKLDSPKSALADMLAIMDKALLPAFLVDQYFDIVAVNLMVLEAYNVNVNDFLDPKSDPVTRFNLLRFLFAPEFNEQKAMLGAFREKFAANTIMLFRAASLRYRATDYFLRLCRHLCEIDELQTYLQRKPKNERYVDNNLFINLDNPRLGAIRAVSASVTAASTAGELRLFVFIPLSEETAKIFSNLAQLNNYIFQPLPDWPDKNVLNGK
jgi:transcriptional regulator with XRE-family HTH domain